MTAAIIVDDVSKRFRIPLDRSNTLKYRIVHPKSSSRYHDFFALHNVGFEVPAGQFIGIVGHNGCGKSTLLKLLARIYKPTSGRVAVHGQVSPFLELGVGFNPELTARENIYLNGALLGLSRADLKRRIDPIIGFAELEQFADQKIKNFSSGMEVRLAFSVAIQADAEVLLMDEVLAVGDARFQAKCFDVFARYKREGRTVVLVTHDLGAVEHYCDRAVLLDHGRLVADGAAAEVAATYRRMVGKLSDAEGLADDIADGVAYARTDDENDGAIAAGPGLDRWGTGQVRITGVDLIDGEGAPRHTFTSGQPMSIRISILTRRPVGELICGIGIHRADGYTIAGTNTFVCNVPLQCPAVGDTAQIDYRMEHLNLLTGSYRVTVAVHSRFGEHPYDHHEQVYRFEVNDEIGRAGLFELGGDWHVDHRLAGISPTPPAPQAPKGGHQ